MPAEKSARVQEHRRKINRITRSTSRTYVRKATRLTLNGSSDEAPSILAKAIGALDWAARKGIIHRNRAARQKSRLTRKFNTGAASAPQPTGRRPGK